MENNLPNAKQIAAAFMNEAIAKKKQEQEAELAAKARDIATDELKALRVKQVWEEVGAALKSVGINASCDKDGLWCRVRVSNVVTGARHLVLSFSAKAYFNKKDELVDDVYAHSNVSLCFSSRAAIVAHIIETVVKYWTNLNL